MEKKEINPRKLELIERSKIARMMQEESEEFADMTINQILLDMYSKGVETKFNTFKGWRKEGFRVKKGEKAFSIWGKKREATKQEETKEEPTEFKFYPICYVFSENQVEPITAE